ncbi:hypothetical protein AB834_02205 [PVC group bacterium (ex Bugula neritina AB1)]|nr:hypothetical protein AB834_02205 [PVC group bacterium (ex Bugula neritina AB1)]
MKKKLELCLATWFGVGNAPFAPGTFGTLAAIPCVLFYNYFLSNFIFLFFTVTSLGFFVSGAAAKQLGSSDPSKIVIDEVAGFILGLCFIPFELKGVLLVFVFFRFFDIVKCWPMSSCEKLSGSLGIMMDDLAAGLLAGTLVHFFYQFGLL